MKLLFENWRQYLNEEQLLIEGRIEDVKKKYPDLDEKGLLDILIDKDPSGNQKYLAWAAKQLAQREDAGKGTADYAAANIELYHRLRAHIPSEYKDINSIKNLLDLERVASSAYQKKAEKDRLKAVEAKYKEEAKENSDVIYKDDDFLVVRPFNQGAACFWGRGSKWCIAATESENWYNKHVGEWGKAFYFIFMKNKNNFMSSDYRQFHKIALMYDERDTGSPESGSGSGEFELAFDASNEEMDASEVVDIIAKNLFGHEFLDAYKEAEDYGLVLEGQFEEDFPEYHATIVSVLNQEDYELDSLEEFWEERVLDIWYQIDGEAMAHLQEKPGGIPPADFEKIRDEADLQYVRVGEIDFYEGRPYYSADMDFDFEDYEFGTPDDPNTLDDYDIEKKIERVVELNDIRVGDLNIEGNTIFIMIYPGEDYYSRDDTQRFENFISEMSEIDENYEEIKEKLIDLFIDEEILDISDEPIGKLQAKLREKELKNFDITITGRTIKSSSNALEYTDVGIEEGAKDILDLMGVSKAQQAPRRAVDRLSRMNNEVRYKIIYFFKQNFQSEEGRSYADNVLFDKMDTLLDQAYRDAEKQLSIPGLEAPETKRLVPPLAISLDPKVYASSQEDAIKLRLHIKADAELGEQQAGYIAEFIEFFDENFDSLKTIVGEVVDKLLKEAIVKALESVKEELPDRARALGVNENKKKRGIRILLGNRR